MRRHGEVRNLYIEQLAYVWVEDPTTEATRASVEEKIDDFVEEGLEHATEMLSASWEIVNKEGDVTAPAEASNCEPVLRLRSFTHFKSADHAGHEPRALGGREDGSYQIDSQGCVL